MAQPWDFSREKKKEKEEEASIPLQYCGTPAQCK